MAMAGCYRVDRNHASSSTVTLPCGSSQGPDQPDETPIPGRRTTKEESDEPGISEGPGDVNGEGDEAELTELAMPEPVEHDISRRPTLEREQRKTKVRLRRNEVLGSNDEFLTEVALPSIAHTTSAPRHEGPTASLDFRPNGITEKDSKSEEKRRRRSSLLTELFIISHLILASILGTLSRLGIEAITRYPQAPVLSPVLWANIGGSFVFGFLSEDRRLFRQEWGAESEHWSFRNLRGHSRDETLQREAGEKHRRTKKTIPLYIGLTTGFCGSFTSFSSFLRDAFLALSNQLPDLSEDIPGQYRSPGYDFEAVMAVMIIQVACSISALQMGAHLALFTERIVPVLPFRFIRRFLDPLVVVLGCGSWLGAVFLSIWPPHGYWRGRVVLSLVFAPPGALLRFYASKHLNGLIPAFPLGTFLVNMFGTAFLGICYDLQRSDSGRSVLVCQTLEGLMEGFCGCLTTVSTWVAELKTLQRRHAYIYGASSLMFALALLVTIMGSVLWARGFGSVTCSV